MNRHLALLLAALLWAGCSSGSDLTIPNTENPPTTPTTPSDPTPTPAATNHAPTISLPADANGYTTVNQNLSGSLLGYAFDEDGDALTAAVVQQPANGSLTLSPDGHYTYEPHTDFAGDDSFQWRAKDATSESAAATINIHVNAVPVAHNDTYHMHPGETLVITNLLANDSEQDGDPYIALPAYQEGPAIPDARGMGLEDNVDFDYNGGTGFAYAWQTSGGFTFTAKEKGDGSFDPQASHTYRIPYLLYEQTASGPRAASATAVVTIIVDPAE